MTSDLPSMRRGDYCPSVESSLFHGISEQELSELNGIFTNVSLEANDYLVHQQSPASHVYNIMSGTLLVERIGLSGRRQILAFLFPGDFFGFAHNQSFEFSVQSLTTANVAAFKRKEFFSICDHLPNLKHNMEEITTNVLFHAFDQVFALGQKKAHERICFLLMQLIQRQPGATEEQLVLPMTRRDIADYLGLTNETVSRAFSKLIKMEIISIDNIYNIKILNLDELKHLASPD